MPHKKKRRSPALSSLKPARKIYTSSDDSSDNGASQMSGGIHVANYSLRKQSAVVNKALYVESSSDDVKDKDKIRKNTPKSIVKT